MKDNGGATRIGGGSLLKAATGKEEGLFCCKLLRPSSSHQQSQKTLYMVRLRAFSAFKTHFLGLPCTFTVSPCLLHLFLLTLDYKGQSFYSYGPFFTTH